jgi:hypothetical protein
MNKSPKSQEQQLDDLLSKFTDQVLSDENETSMHEITAQDELAELQKTILRLKAAAKKARASDNADVRIRNRLLMEWGKNRRAESAAPKRFTWNWTFPRFALAGGFAVLILISVVTLLSPATAPLTATSDGTRPWSPFFILTGIIIIAYLLWRNRHD